MLSENELEERIAIVLIGWGVISMGIAGIGKDGHIIIGSCILGLLIGITLIEGWEETTTAFRKYKLGSELEETDDGQ